MNTSITKVITKTQLCHEHYSNENNEAKIKGSNDNYENITSDSHLVKYISNMTQ